MTIRIWPTARKWPEIGRSIDNKFYLKIRRFQLVERARSACRDTIDYEQRLADFCLNNRNNLRLLTQVKGMRIYFLAGGLSESEAAKQILDFYSGNNL